MLLLLLLIHIYAIKSKLLALANSLSMTRRNLPVCNAVVVFSCLIFTKNIFILTSHQVFLCCRDIYKGLSMSLWASHDDDVPANPLPALLCHCEGPGLPSQPWRCCRGGDPAGPADLGTGACRIYQVSTAVARGRF